jgi:hypothetical protein
VSFVRVRDAVPAELSPYELVALAVIVIAPSLSDEPFTPVNGAVPAPDVPDCVAVIVWAEPTSVSVKVMVSVESDVAGSTTSKLRLLAFAVLMNALPAPAPFTSDTDVGSAGAIVAEALFELSAPSQL